MSRRFYIAMIAMFMVCINATASNITLLENLNDTAEVVVPDIPETPDTEDNIPPVVPDTGTVVPQPSEPQAPSIEGRNVVEYPHITVDNKKQHLSLSLEKTDLRIKGCIWAQGKGKHYLDYNIMADSVHIQRIDMDYKNSKTYLIEIDVLIPGFTAKEYKVTFEGLDEDLSAPSEAKMRNTVQVARNNTDGINSITPQKKNDSNIYDLKGRKVKKTKKGIYIKNGKKVVASQQNSIPDPKKKIVNIKDSFMIGVGLNLGGSLLLL